MNCAKYDTMAVAECESSWTILVGKASVHRAELQPLLFLVNVTEEEWEIDAMGGSKRDCMCLGA